MASARAMAVSMLCETFENNEYTNIVLDKKLKESQLESKDKAFLTMLYYGVVERKITLDYIISCFVKKKIDDIVRQILRCGIYQIKYMDSVPDNAAVNESVKLASKFKKKSAAGFINAVLRNFIRSGKEIKYPENRIEMLEVKYSVPEKFIKHLINDYGEEKTCEFLESTLEKSSIMIRQNIKKGSSADFESMFKQGELEKHSQIDNCYYLKCGNIQKHPAFKKGYFHVQDAASQLCCMALDTNSNDKIVYDVCSAPGGKAFTLAENFDGTLYAWDLYESRVNLIKDGAKRLGLENIKAQAGDSSSLPENLPLADKILCDVPCSGYGVIGKKPEIKYRDIDENKGLPDIQYKILQEAAHHLKNGGEIVYSTCTLSKAENENNVEKFLAENKDFKAVNPLPFFEKTKDMKYVTLFPSMFGSDGFFIAKLQKIKEK